MGAVGNAIIYIINEGFVARTINNQENQTVVINDCERNLDNSTTFRISLTNTTTGFDNYVQEINAYI
jgi:hypothetical protein